MALYITEQKFPFPRQWHIGEPWPDISGRVVTFQADGDELVWLLELIRADRAKQVGKGSALGRIANVIHSHPAGSLQGWGEIQAILVEYFNGRMVA